MWLDFSVVYCGTKNITYQQLLCHEVGTQLGYISSKLFLIKSQIEIWDCRLIVVKTK